MDATTTKIAIINKALSRIKKTNIQELGEQTEEARVANQFYDCERKAILRGANWKWATVKKRLVELGNQEDATNNPTVEASQDVAPQWSYLYTYPVDAVRVVRVFDAQKSLLPDVFQDQSQSQFIKQGRDPDMEILRSPITDVVAIACNMQEAWVEYIKNITDESQFDDLFIEAFELALAAAMAIPLTADKELALFVEQKAAQALDLAREKNGNEGPSRQPYESPYESCREGGSSAHMSV